MVLWWFLGLGKIDIFFHSHFIDKETEAWNFWLTWETCAVQWEAEQGLEPGDLVAFPVLSPCHTTPYVGFVFCCPPLWRSLHSRTLSSPSSLPSTPRVPGSFSSFCHLKRHHLDKPSSEQTQKALSPFFSITGICASFIGFIIVSNVFLSMALFCVCLH